MRKALGVFVVGLFLGMFGVSAQAELPKSGKYSLYYSWHAIGHMIPLAEGFVLSSGSAWGVVINRATIKNCAHDNNTTTAHNAVVSSAAARTNRNKAASVAAAASAAGNRAAHSFTPNAFKLAAISQ